MKTIILSLCKATGLFWVAGYVNRKKLCILCYHGLALGDQSSFRPKLFMKRQSFLTRMKRLKETGRPVLPLSEAVRRMYAGTLPDNAVVITIDDGFYSTYLWAIPALKTLEFPATIYITTYYAEKRTPIYRLFVQYAFWKTQALHLDQSRVLGEFLENVDLTDSRQRDRAINKFIEYGERRSVEEQMAISERLGDALGIPFSEVRATRCLTLMTKEEIANLSHYDVDVQLHTHRHRLPLDRETVLREINENRGVLQKVASSPQEHLCYPSGEWSPALWPWLAEAGISTATTCDYGLNDHTTNRLALMRLLDGEDVSQLEFDAALSGFSMWLQGIKTVINRLRWNRRPAKPAADVFSTNRS